MAWKIQLREKRETDWCNRRYKGEIIRSFEGKGEIQIAKRVLAIMRKFGCREWLIMGMIFSWPLFI